ncbi:Tim44/TimA family putative adaptor protein [Roseovarius nubinhibens]|nr:Tim44/TimA family putative adaptor protein [Roseovarius nubinhibens]
MDSPMLQLLVLAGIAIFLLLRLRSVLGTRDGFEPPRSELPGAPDRRQGFEVIEGGPDLDITDHVPEDSDAAAALAEMKRIEPSFSVSEFLSGSRQAYEWILMSFENGKLDEIVPFLSPDVHEAFAQVIDARQEKNLTVEAEFYGVRDVTLIDAALDDTTKAAEITVKFLGELSSVVRNEQGEIIEGTPGEPKRQKDTWTFERVMGSDDPNWRLVATGG